MSVKRIHVVLLAAGFLLLLATPGHAQIASYIDGTGKRVFVNGDAPKRSNGSTITPASRKGAPPKAAASSASLASPVLASPNDHIERIVQDAAARHQLDPALVKAVINTESGWNPSAISRKGAVGLMQLVPGTAQRFGVGNPYDPAQNIEGGTTYLKALLERYDGDLSKTLAAYNAGEGAVDRSGGIPWYPETRRYVKKVTETYFRPESGRGPTVWSRRPTVRREVDASGRVIFTND